MGMVAGFGKAAISILAMHDFLLAAEPLIRDKMFLVTAGHIVIGVDLYPMVFALIIFAAYLLALIQIISKPSRTR